MVDEVGKPSSEWNVSNSHIKFIANPFYSNEIAYIFITTEKQSLKIYYKDNENVIVKYCIELHPVDQKSLHWLKWAKKVIVANCMQS